MRRLWLISGFVIILSIQFAQAGEQPKSKAQLLLVGELNRDAVTLKSGETWFGLYQVKGGFELIPSTVIIETFHDACIDEEGHNTGKEVKVNRQDTPLFLMKDLENLKSGPITTAVSSPIKLKPEQAITIDLGKNNHYLLTISSPNPLSSDQEQNDYCSGCDFKLFSGRKSQVITTEGFDWAKILWAGDLNGDNKLDLFMEFDKEGHGPEYHLFVSSGLDEDGKLIKEVLCYYFLSC